MTVESLSKARIRDKMSRVEYERDLGNVDFELLFLEYICQLRLQYSKLELVLAKGLCLNVVHADDGSELLKHHSGVVFYIVKHLVGVILKRDLELIGS